MFHNSLFSHR